MPIAERTYSFRAAADLAPRVREALDCWEDMLGSAGSRPGDEDTAREFYLCFWRQIEQLAELRDNQSALLRGLTELFVSATEKIAEDRAAISEYEAWSREDSEGVPLRKGALRAGAERWRDE